MSNVTVVYDVKPQPVKALDDVSLTIPSTGYSLGLVGESGSGKTTLGMTTLRVLESPGKMSTGAFSIRTRMCWQCRRESSGDTGGKRSPWSIKAR